MNLWWVDGHPSVPFYSTNGLRLFSLFATADHAREMTFVTRKILPYPTFFLSLLVFTLFAVFASALRAFTMALMNVFDACSFSHFSTDVVSHGLTIRITYAVTDRRSVTSPHCRSYACSNARYVTQRERSTSPKRHIIVTPLRTAPCNSDVPTRSVHCVQVSFVLAQAGVSFSLCVFSLKQHRRHYQHRSRGCGRRHASNCRVHSWLLREKYR